MSRNRANTGIPVIVAARPVPVPRLVEARLPNGLRAVAVRSPSVPRFELRLRIPSGLASERGAGLGARIAAETLLGGTPAQTSLEIAEELQRLGCSVHAGIGRDFFTISGGGLARNLRPCLELLAGILCNATFPEEEVDVARSRLAQEIMIDRAQPGTQAREALNKRLFGRHPYGRPKPDPVVVMRTEAAAARKFHSGRVAPRGATLLIVSSRRTDDVLEVARDSFRPWRPRPGGPEVPKPGTPSGRPALVIDRPLSVQTSIRIGGMAVNRSHPDYFKLTLANTIFGGYFSSRLVENIREDKGYTYSPRSSIEHKTMASVLVIAADVATEVTAPALVEIGYELRKMAALPVEEAELESARRYLSGLMSLSIQSQSGLAGTLDSLLAAGLDANYLKSYQRNLDAVDAAGVGEAAARYLAPRNLSTVLVGSAEGMAAAVSAIEDVEQA